MIRYLKARLTPGEFSGRYWAALSDASPEVVFPVDETCLVRNPFWVRGDIAFVPVTVISERDGETVAVLPQPTASGNTLVCLPSRQFCDLPKDPLTMFLDRRAILHAEF
jgi:hypothetical protein